MIIYQPLKAKQQEFVEFWNLRYEYAEENLYLNNVGQKLTEQRILELYRWKNGMKLSNEKRESVCRNFVKRRGELEQLQPNVNAIDFLARFADGGAIWRIFWLHCWRPNRFPIYDKHVHRAMAFINNGDPEEIPQNDPRKIRAYIERNLPFHAQFSALDGRDVDRALWAFGKFINEVKFPMVALNESY